MCLPFAGLSRIISSLYLHVIRGVFADAPQSFLKHDKGSSAHSDRSDFLSRFPTLISSLTVTLPQGRQVGS